jgi:hypothetical protein
MYQTCCLTYFPIFLYDETTWSYNSFNYKIILHFIISCNRDLSGFTVLQFFILWDRNDYYRRFNLPFALSILFKTLQVLIASVPHSVLVYIYSSYIL